MAAIEWPTGLRPQRSAWSVKNNNRTFTSTLSNAMQVVTFPGSYWTCSVAFSVIDRRTQAHRDYFYLIDSLEGMRGSVKVPAFGMPSSPDLGALVLSSAAAVNGRQLLVSGFTGSDALRSGDCLTVADQMFRVVGSVPVSDGVGVVTVNRPIRVGIPSGTAVEYRNPYCLMRLTTDTAGVSNEPVLSSANLEFREYF